MTWCDTCATHHAMPECPWDWPGVEAQEAAAQRKADRLAKCKHCGNPMWCGQRYAHHNCVKENDVSV